MSVRYGCAADIPMVLRLARREHEASPWADIAFDPRATEATICSFLHLVGRTLLVSDAGYLAGLVQPMGFANQRQAIEFAWYAEDGEGMSLLTAFEAWAQRMGCVMVVSHAHISGDRLERVLTRRRGYARLGSVMTKRLEH